MKNKTVCGLLLLGYCVPYVFFAMYGDAEAHTMLLYGLLIAAMGLLCLGCVKAGSLPVLVIGNILSCFTSLICVNGVQSEKWVWYFKPFRAASLAVFISLITLIIQIAIWKAASKRSKP